MILLYDVQNETDYHSRNDIFPFITNILTFVKYFAILDYKYTYSRERWPMRLVKKIIFWVILNFLLISNFKCASTYYLDAPVSDPIMFVDDNQNSDLSRVEDGGMAGSAGECPT